MKFSELKTGMRVVTADGTTFIYIADVKMFVSQNSGYMMARSFNEDLTCVSMPEDFNIVEVYDVPGPVVLLDFSIKGSLLWRRHMRMSAANVFDADGMFVFRHYDPYRAYVEDDNIAAIHNSIFDVYGAVTTEFMDDLYTYLNSNPDLSFKCDAVKLFYAQMHGRNTSGNYPAVYMWK